MIVIDNWEDLQGKELVATIGFFDGVHRGHRFLIDDLKEIAHTRSLPAAVITFPNHPQMVLHPGFHPNLLNSFEEKLDLLASTGIDYCIVLDFTHELSCLSAHDFITDVLRERMHVHTLLIGYDHRFGHNREEGFDDYVAFGAACGMEVLKAAPYDKGEVDVSSSRIRSLLAEGKVEVAAELLSYPYELCGEVVEGRKLGRTIGFPTANLRLEESLQLLPAIGIYAVWVKVEGVFYKGMLYIGNRPTVHNGTDVSVEVNILNFSGDLYTKVITVSFLYYVREDITFSSLEELRLQLMRDRDKVEKLLNVTNLPSAWNTITKQSTSSKE